MEHCEDCGKPGIDTDVNVWNVAGTEWMGTREVCWACSTAY